MVELMVALAVLACPVGMGLMMLMMGRGMAGGRTHAKGPRVDGAAADGDLGSLKAEQARIADRIGRLERERAARADGSR